MKADLNGDGRPDMLAQYTPDSTFCGATGCSGVIVMATSNGYSRQSIDLPNFYAKMEILAQTHLGMHDLRFDDATHIFKWDGKQYR